MTNSFHPVRGLALPDCILVNSTGNVFKPMTDIMLVLKELQLLFLVSLVSALLVYGYSSSSPKWSFSYLLGSNFLWGNRFRLGGLFKAQDILKGGEAFHPAGKCLKLRK